MSKSADIFNFNVTNYCMLNDSSAIYSIIQVPRKNTTITKSDISIKKPQMYKTIDDLAPLLHTQIHTYESRRRVSKTKNSMSVVI